MRAEDHTVVRLVGDERSAQKARVALYAAWRILPLGKERDEIYALYTQLGYAIEAAGGDMDESDDHTS